MATLEIVYKYKWALAGVPKERRKREKLQSSDPKE